MEEAGRLAQRIVVIDTGRVIAQGTAEQLKDRLGGDLLEARVTDHADLDRAAALLAEIAQAVPHLDHDQQRVSVPTKGGTRFLITAGRRFEDDEIPLDDLGIRGPRSTTFSSPSTAPSRARPTTVNPTTPRRTDDRSTFVQPLARSAPHETGDRGAATQPASRSATCSVPAHTADARHWGDAAGNGAAAPPLRLRRRDPGLRRPLRRLRRPGRVHRSSPDRRHDDLDRPCPRPAQRHHRRFRSLPMARSAVLAGRTDLSRSLFSLALMVGLGLLVGFRFHARVASIVAGMALIITFGYAFSWMYASIVLATKDPETAQVAGILHFFILMFASNAVVPVATMPGWLQPFAPTNP